MSERSNEQVSQCECEFVACCSHIHGKTRLSPTIRPVFEHTHTHARAHPSVQYTFASATDKMSALHEVQMSAGKSLGAEGEGTSIKNTQKVRAKRERMA